MNKIGKVKKRAGFKKIFSNNWFVFKYAFKISPTYVLMICLFPVMQSIVLFFQYVFVVPFVLDSIQLNRPFLHVAFYILLIFALSALLLLLSNKFTYGGYRRKCQLRLNRALQIDICERAAKIDLSCYDDPEHYNDFVWSMNESTVRVDSVLNSVAAFASAIVGIFISGVFMIAYEFVGVTLVVISFVFNFLINLKTSKIRHNMDVAIQPKSRKRDYINRVFYLKDFVKEIRLSNIRSKLFKDFDDNNRKIIEGIKEPTKKLTNLTFFSRFFLNTFLFNGIYVAYLVLRVVGDTLSYGAMAGLFQSSRYLYRNLNEFAEVLPRFQNNSLYIEKMRAFMEYEPKIHDHKDANTAPMLSTLKLKDVSFSYCKGTSILKDINLEVKPKQKIAIVGYNGAGKTTLVNLIMRLYDVERGEILYGGKNIKNYKLDDYRSKIGAVFQDYQYFAATICENVAMDCNFDLDKIEKSLIKADFTKKIESLKKWNDGKSIEMQLTYEFYNDGIELSGGEAQKVAIARVLYKDSDIIILDEPSSALDPISEYKLNETILEIAKEKSVIFISHRLSTTKMADVIYMMENGKIIEQGSHENLMNLCGKYAEMYNVQAEKYRLNIDSSARNKNVKINK